MAPKMVVPGVDLQANYRAIKTEVQEAINRVLDSAYYILGPDVEAFEKEFAAYSGAQYGIGVSNGSDALVLCLQVLGIGAGDEVIVQANTYCATVFAISQVGAIPVLVDIDNETLMMDTTKIEAKITPKTKALMPVHLFGLSVNMDHVMEIAKKHNLFVVEDCSQAHGAKWNGKGVGNFGHLAGWSLYPGKNLGAYGDAGIITTDNKEYADKLKMLRHMGQAKKYFHEIKGVNNRLDNLQAAILRVRLKYLEQWNDRRREVANIYSKALQGVGDLKVPVVDSHVFPVWHLYVVRSDKRDALLKYLNDNGVMAQIHYPIPIHRLGAYKELAHYEPELPVSTKEAERILSLPIYPDITQEQIDYVIETTKAFFAQ